jgi:hypothetical protein
MIDMRRGGEKEKRRRFKKKRKGKIQFYFLYPSQKCVLVVERYLFIYCLSKSKSKYT